MSFFSWNRNADSQRTADRREQQAVRPFEGRLVSISSRKLVMLNRKGMKSSHSLAKDARLTCDGASCELEDLKAGSNIRVTAEQDNWKHVTWVEALDKQSEFTQCGK